MSVDLLVHLQNTKAPTLYVVFRLFVEIAEWPPWVWSSGFTFCSSMHRNAGEPEPFLSLPFHKMGRNTFATSEVARDQERFSPWLFFLFSFPRCTPQSGGPLLPWWHSTGWRRLEIMTTGNSGEAEPEWWLASEERPVWAERQQKKEGTGGRAWFNKSWADATCLQQLGITGPGNAPCQSAVHFYRISLWLPGLSFFITQSSRFKCSKYLLLISILAPSPER